MALSDTPGDHAEVVVLDDIDEASEAGKHPRVCVCACCGSERLVVCSLLVASFSSPNRSLHKNQKCQKNQKPKKQSVSCSLTRFVGW
jgi:hypothetical protein